MKRIISICCLLLLAGIAFAQPGWVKKATKSVFTVKTFAADGSMIASSNGFFTGNNGEAVSNFSPFKGAVRAVVIDAQGKELKVVSILGANDMYDIVKFRVSGKTQPLVISSITEAPVDDVVSSLSSALSAGQEKVEDLKDAANSAKEAVENAPEALKEKGQEVVDKAKEEAGKKVDEAAQKGVDAVKKGLGI